MKKALAVIFSLMLVISAAACSSNSGNESANYPTKSIEFVAAGAPGGGLDTFARAIDQALKEANLSDKPFIIKNMGGAGGNEAKAYIHKQKGDPYYLYAESNRIYVNQIVGTTDLGIEDVTPIGRLITEYIVWAVRSDSPYQNAKEILDQLKQDPSSIEFGVGTIPSNDQMNILRPAIEYGIDPAKIRIVAFKDGGDLMTQLLGGHIPVISTGASEAIEQAKAGKVRILAVSAPEPVGGDLEGVPTWKSMGIDVSILHWRGVFAPPGVPQEVVAYWDKKLGELVKTDAWKQTLERYGWFDAYANSEEFKKELQEEHELTEKLLKDLGLAK